MKVALVVLLFCGVCFAQLTCQNQKEFFKKPSGALMNSVMPMKEKEINACKAAGFCPTALPSAGKTACNAVTGMAGEYPCSFIDQLSFVSLSDLGSSGDGNDIWGWTDSTTNKEYALMCCEDGTSFVDVTDGENPIVLGFLPTQTTSTIWRDVKVYKDHAFIVSEAPNHGMQIFDLTQLRDMSGDSVQTLEPTYYYDQFGSAHNIVINEESGYAYIVGTRTCDGGLHIVDISSPANATCAGCFWQDGYTHDAQCVNYDGPDSQYVGKEICFCYNEDTLTIVDVTNKHAMVEIARKPYDGSQYTHQGWLTMDSRFLFLNDELDEQAGTTGGPDNGKNTRTLIWDVSDLDNPVWVNTFFSTLTAVDHNLYVNGTYVFEANYCAGLRILKFTDPIIGAPRLTEVAYFDVAPNCDGTSFFGSWSNYPYFASGNIIVSSIERGLFVLRPQLHLLDQN
jgi:choice-of-anchor B domain-containing protein